MSVQELIAVINEEGTVPERSPQGGVWGQVFTLSWAIEGRQQKGKDNS